MLLWQARLSTGVQAWHMQVMTNLLKPELGVRSLTARPSLPPHVLPPLPTGTHDCCMRLATHASFAVSGGSLLPPDRRLQRTAGLLTIVLIPNGTLESVCEASGGVQGPLGPNLPVLAPAMPQNQWLAGVGRQPCGL